MKDFLKKVADFLLDVWEKIEKFTDKLSKETGLKINAPLLVGLVFLFIFFFIIVKSILGWVFSSL